MKACTQCGRCCTEPSFMGSLQATSEDVRRWRREGRSDILAWASVIEFGDAVFADLWVSPRTGNEAERCPFVRKVRNQNRYTCTIYETRPEVCRNYPLGVRHMAAVDCEMLEPGDTDEDVRRFMIDAASSD